MIKGIFFDYDGVIVELVEVHYHSLNQAIEEIAGKSYVIQREEQNNTYNGLSTKTKLKLLIRNKDLPPDFCEPIAKLKQQYTLQAIEDYIKPNPTLRQDLQRLKNEGFVLYCISNALIETVQLGLTKLNVDDLFDHIMGNDDIKHQKPAPECYLKAFIHSGLDPKEVLIVEDSKHGREAAQRSGAYLCTVDNQDQTTYDHIKSSLNKINHRPVRWSDNKLNIILPMSGLGSRFKVMGFERPKPLINVKGKPMIQLVVENMNVDANYIFIVQRSHYEQYNLGYLLPLIAPNCKIIKLDGITEGAACSVLKAKELIDNDNHLFIINSDQYLIWDSADFFNKMLTSKADGGIITFKKENDPKWSYAKLDARGYVCEVKEKQPISDLATIGGYYFDKGKDFVSSAEKMIENNDKSNGEYYVAPCYNYMIKNNNKIISYEIPTENFYGLGVPDDLDFFLKNYRS